MEQAIRDLHGGEMLTAMKDCTLKVQREAKLNLVAWKSPEVGGVDTGITRASIMPEVRLSGDVVEGVVGSKKMSALIQEVGSKPHWPPVKIFELWARRHGANAYLVGRAIAKRGNKPRKFLSKAFESSKDYIIRRFEKAAADIARKAND